MIATVAVKGCPMHMCVIATIAFKGLDNKRIATTLQELCMCVCVCRIATVAAQGCPMHMRVIATIAVETLETKGEFQKIR